MTTVLAIAIVLFLTLEAVTWATATPCPRCRSRLWFDARLRRCGRCEMWRART